MHVSKQINFLYTRTGGNNKTDVISITNKITVIVIEYDFAFFLSDLSFSFINLDKILSMYFLCQKKQIHIISFYHTSPFCGMPRIIEDDLVSIKDHTMTI